MIRVFKWSFFGLYFRLKGCFFFLNKNFSAFLFLFKDSAGKVESEKNWHYLLKLPTSKQTFQAPCGNVSIEFVFLNHLC